MNPEHEYHEGMSAFLSSTVLGQSQEEKQEVPQQDGHGSADGGAHGPPPRMQKSESDHILDVLYDGNYYDGVSWTSGRGGA